MIGVITIAALFMVIILVGILGVVFEIKSMIAKNQAQYNDVVNRVGNVEQLFKNEINAVLGTMKKILKVPSEN